VTHARERLAVIDLGSNSFRLVVFMAWDGWWRRTDEIYEPVRIGEGLAASGRLSEEPMRRALATLDVFDHFCRAAGLGGRCVDALATSAIRDAENAAGFLALARERTSLPIRVLSREEEARYGYLAAVNSTTLTDGCVLDLGGGSLQLVRVADRAARELGSWRLGSVRMTERFLPANGPAKRRQIEQLREHVAGELERAAWLARAGPRLVGVGGTVRNLAAAVQRASGLPSGGVQAAIVSREALEELVERLAALPASERSSVPGIKPARADLILAGAIVVQGALLAGGFDGLEVTEAGLREGVFFERLLADRDPPLFADLRRTSVLNLAAHSPIEVAIVAQAARYHRKGMPDPGPLAALFAPEDVARLDRCAVLLRLAEDLERSRDQLVRATRFELVGSCGEATPAGPSANGSGGEIELRLIADGESAVPRWAARRESELFARAFHRELLVAA
jgi:exopolyphosphatase / guanosine-5'-triphosphate,3'-diphosphate pyrophosphatase